MSSGNLRWKADSQVRSKVEDAIEEWEDEIDELGWSRVSRNWDIEFVYEDCDGMHAFYDVTDWDYDRTREARYWEEAKICIDSNFDWEGDGQLSAIAHEIGHAYGLHERYIDNRGAARCSSERTIMDTFRPNSGGRHCDGLTGPASNDVDRVEEIFEEGELEDSSTRLRRTTLTFAWEDEAWGEDHHHLEYSYWNSSNSKWDLLESEDIEDFTGRHEDMEDPFTIADSNDLSRYNKGSGYYVACVWPYFKQYGTYGTSACSDVVRLR